MTELAVVLASGSLGSMLFFSAAIAPTVFQSLPEEYAAGLLRALFPKYFLINGAMAVLAGLIAFRVTEGAILVGCGVVMLAVRYFAIPIINDARDGMLDGDQAAAHQFAFWHRGTVLLNVCQMFGLAVAIVLLLGPRT